MHGFIDGTNIKFSEKNLLLSLTDITLLNKYVLNSDHMPDTEWDTGVKMVSNIGTISFIQTNNCIYSKCCEINM